MIYPNTPEGLATMAQPDLSIIRKERIENNVRNMEFLSKKLRVIAPHTTTFNFYLTCYEDARVDIMHQEALLALEAL